MLAQSFLQDPGTVGWLLAALLVPIVISAVSARFKQSKFPVINPLATSRWGLSSSTDKQGFLQNARQLVLDGTEKFQKPFAINTENGQKIVLPNSYAEAVKNDPRLSFNATTEKEFFTHYPGFEALDPKTSGWIAQETVRIKLTQNLASLTEALVEETKLVLDSRWSWKDSDWHSIDLGEQVLNLVAHLSARAFLGPEMAHSEEWLKMSIDYTLIVFNAARALRLWPVGTRWLAVYFVPECVHLRATTKRARAMIDDMVAKRSADKASGEKVRNDVLEWMEQVAKGKAFDPAAAQLGLTMAAIHTTTDLTKQTLLDLAQHPQLVEDLRKEISEVVAQHGWEKTSLYKMKLLDSAIKETQRLKPPSIVSMNRIVLDDMTLPDGTVLPKGSRVITSSGSQWDEAVHSRASEYDGARFMKMRQTAGRENTGQLVSVTADHISFGYGKHACPGRFFAANEVKISLAYILLNYDLRLADPSAAAPMPYGFELIVNPMAKLDVRRRT